MLHLLTDVFRNSLLITGLVIIMMLAIEYVNVGSHGRWLSRLKSSGPGQVLLASLLGLVPGCIGGFAAVSLYSHGILSFGALVAMMICSSGDEAFVLLALIPREALILFAVLFVTGMGTGLLADRILPRRPLPAGCGQEFEIHSDGHGGACRPSLWKWSSYRSLRHAGRHKWIVLAGILVFVCAIGAGLLEHEHGTGEAACGHTCESHTHPETPEAPPAGTAESTPHLHDASGPELHPASSGFNLLNERWLNLLFAGLALLVLLMTATASDHFIEEHIWNHVVRKHALPIFLWTFGALAAIQFGLQHLDIGHWIRANPAFMVLLAALIGIIPESGPHMIFITLFAGGYIPFPVLLASSISQDGHTSLPLLAHSKRSFLLAKAVNFLVALVLGLALLPFFPVS